MGHQLKLTHEQMLAYLQGNGDKENREYVAKLREEDSVYHLFFDLVDDLKHHAAFRKQPARFDDIPSTFSAIEDMLMRIFAGNVEEIDAQHFLDGLVFSPLFYERLMIKFAATTPQIALDDVPEIAQGKVYIKTDEEVMEKVISVMDTQTRVDDLHVHDLTPRFLAGVGDVFHQLLESTRRLPRYAWALPIVVAGIFVVLLNYEKIIPKDPYSQYVYDDRVPYAYDVGSLRSPTVASEFVNSFKLGLIEYMRCDYVGSVRIFESLEPTVLELQSSLPHDNLQTWIRDYYFYLGMSHFALARSKKLNLDQSVKAKHSAAAIRYLSEADSLAQSHQLEGNDREIFFLGLAYACSKQFDLANLTLKRIKPESRFYNESVALIKKLPNKPVDG